MERKIETITKLINQWVLFGYNYHVCGDEPKDWIGEIFGDVEKTWQGRHFYEKFMGYYERYGAHAVMNVWFCNMTTDNQEKVVEYFLKKYTKMEVEQSLI